MSTDPEKCIQINVDAGRVTGDLPHTWNYIGYDEINYTYTPDGQELLAKFGTLQEKPYYVRAHHLLCTGNVHGTYKWGSTNCYAEDDQGNPVYNWTFVDLIFDTILKHQCKPFVEIGFMPQDLADPAYYDAANEGRRMQNYRATGWACPPKDYQKWYGLVHDLVQHCVERHGVDEVRTWYWELWNEPDGMYWQASIEEFNKLYDYTAAAVKAACSEARVGGPAVTRPVYGRKSVEYLDKFLDHCVNGVNYITGKKGTPIDFTSFHVKGGRYAANLKAHKETPPSVQQVLSQLQVGYEIISKYPGMAGRECVLSEADTDGWAAGGAWDNINMNFRNTEYYASWVATAFDKIRKFARQRKWDVRPLTWAFMFVAERCFEGTRTFSTQGIDKAILNLFRLYAKMGTQEVAFESTGTKDPFTYPDLIGAGVEPDISGFAALTGTKSLEIMVYNHHDDWDVSGEYQVDLSIANLPFAGPYTVMHYRIDQTHSNAYREWVRQGKPMYPDAGQYAAIKARDGLELAEPPQKVGLSAGKLKRSFTLPVHGVSLLVVSPAE